MGGVEEYTTDGLAADSDDEKCPEKAKRVAEKKAAKHRKAATDTYNVHVVGWSPTESHTPIVLSSIAASKITAEQPVV